MNPRGALVPAGVDLFGNMHVNVVTGVETVLDVERLESGHIRGNAVAPLALEILAPIQLNLDLGLRLETEHPARQVVEAK